MPRYYYGAVPVLAWIINHYFYGRVHYSWLAKRFAPFDTNPKSSNPYQIYGDLYWAWMRRDRYDKFVNETRRTLGKVVARKQEDGLLDNVTAARLVRVCASENVDLYYPVIYRVDAERIASSRQITANSGLGGSEEVLIPDLAEEEFDLLFADNTADELFRSLVLEERAEDRWEPLEVLALLEKRIR
jgi:hypothetical protein